MNIGIVGGGYIVPEFLTAARATKGLQVHGIWARRAEIREKFVSEWTIPVSYDSYEALLADPAIDAIYLALNNHLHLSFGLQALDAGKDLLLEKPMTVTLDGTRQLYDRAAQRGRIIFEMITNQYCPAFSAVAERLPQLGALRLVFLNYTQYSKRYDKFRQGIIEPVFDPGKSGGALLDLNIYNLHLAVGWFGVPKQVRYLPTIQRGIDTSGTVILEYEGFLCMCTAAKDCRGAAGLTIQGENGYISSEVPPNILSGFSLHLPEQTPEHIQFAPRESRFCDELDAFVAHYEPRDDVWFRERAAHSLRVMEVLDAAIQSGGLALAGDQ